MAGTEEVALFETGSGNVFADLGLEDAEELQAKAQLVRAISKTMAGKGMTQAELATTLGIHQTKVSKLLRGITDGFSSDRLLSILSCLDQDVEIIIRPKPPTESRHGRVSVALLSAAPKS